MGDAEAYIAKTATVDGNGKPTFSDTLLSITYTHPGNGYQIVPLNQVLNIDANVDYWLLSKTPSNSTPVYTSLNKPAGVLSYAREDDGEWSSIPFTAACFMYENYNGDIPKIKGFDSTVAIQDVPSSYISNKVVVSAVYSNNKLSFSNNIPSRASVSIFNISGQLIMKTDIVNFAVSLPNLSKGIYMAKITSNISVHSIKFTVR
jgi:hypothetical protein